MRTEPLPSQIFVNHRESLRSLLKPGALVVVQPNDIYPTNADGTLPYQQQSDLMHLTGIRQEETILLMMPDAVDERDREILFVRKTSETIAVWEGHKLSKDQAREQSGIQRVEWTEEFEGIFQRLAMQAERIYLASNEHPRSTQIVATRNDRFTQQCREKFPLHRFERL
ncbi:MAG: aminopeptidase P N-terminal domain-containing protein, partial [Luteolibacter sp.]